MDMRFPGFDAGPARGAATPAVIDFRVFVAALAAGQMVSPAARAAAQAKSACRRTTRRAPPALLRALDGASPARPAGAFHRAAATGVEVSASNVKRLFTVAFQPSFKPADL